MTEQTQRVGGGCGCIGLIVTVLVIWAVAFGVTWNGHHYTLDCSCDRGVQVQ